MHPYSNRMHLAGVLRGTGNVSTYRLDWNSWHSLAANWLNPDAPDLASLVLILCSVECSAGYGRVAGLPGLSNVISGWARWSSEWSGCGLERWTDGRGEQVEPATAPAIG